jgi:hypothetical protein
MPCLDLILGTSAVPARHGPGRAAHLAMYTCEQPRPDPQQNLAASAGRGTPKPPSSHAHGTPRIPCSRQSPRAPSSAAASMDSTPAPEAAPGASSSSPAAAAAAEGLAGGVAAMTLDERFEMLRGIGEECIQEDELRRLLQNKPVPICYDGFEPSGRMHIAQV